MNSVLKLGLERWSTWQNRSINRRILAAMMTVGGLTGLAKIAAVGKEAVVAYQFGPSDALDAFLMAFLVPQLAIGLIGGSINAALIPTYIQVMEQEGQKAAHRLYRSVMILSAGLLAIMSGVLACTAHFILPIVASGFSQEKLALATSLFYVLLVTLVLSGLAMTWSAVLNAENRFALASGAPIITSIVTIFWVLVMARESGIYALAIGIAIGTAIETGIVALGLLLGGISLVPRWYGLTLATKQVLGQYVPAVAGSSIVVGSGMVSQSMAAMLSPGSVSVLSFGSKVSNLILGVGAVAVSTAIFPHFSRMVAKQDWSALQHTLLTYFRMILLVSVPTTIFLIYFSVPLVSVLFQRGAFTERDTNLVSRVQVMYLLQIVPYVLIMVLVRLLAAFQANHLLMWSAAINFFGTIICTYMFMQWFDVMGIALATSVSHMLSFCFLLAVSVQMIKKRNREKEIEESLNA